MKTNLLWLCLAGGALLRAHDEPPAAAPRPRAADATAFPACLAPRAASSETPDGCAALGFGMAPATPPFEVEAAERLPEFGEPLAGPLGDSDPGADSGMERFLAGAAAPAAPVAAPESGPARGWLGFRWAPAAWAAPGVRLERAGLGPVAAADRDSGASIDAGVAGVASGGTLGYRFALTPGTRAYGWRAGRTASDAARDGVETRAGAGSFASYRTLRAESALAWQLTALQRLALSAWAEDGVADGALRVDAWRIAASADPGIIAQPDPAGAPDTAPRDAVRGRHRLRERGAALGWRRETAEGWTLDAGLAWRRFTSRETPAAAADQVNYNDIRRTQIFAMQVHAGYAPLVTPSQYRFGGLGLFDAGHLDERLGLSTGASRAFDWHGTHRVTARAEGWRQRAGENRRRSGVRGEAGPLVALRSFYGYPIPSSIIRLRQGFTAQVVCGRVDPAGRTFEEACSTVAYQINRAALNPPERPLRINGVRAGIADEWTRGRWTMSGALRLDRVGFRDDDDYTLYSDATGEILTGTDGWWVGAREDDVPIDPSGTLEPVYASDHGRFPSGRHRFPLEWSARLAAAWDSGDPRIPRVSAAWSREALPLPVELAEHAFENGFGVATMQFSNPDLTGQYGASTTYGGGRALVAPGTRLPREERWTLSARGTTGRVEWRVALGRVALRRVLAHTQANSVEAVMNRTYDGLVMNDYLYGTRYCLNCARGQTSLFPDYPGLYLNGDPGQFNTASRFLLAEVLANPGENTAPGRFPRPRHHTDTLRLEAEAPLGGPPGFSLHAALELARTRGNYAGPFELDSGLDHAELSSQYAYPLSGLTASAYRDGPQEAAYGGAPLAPAAAGEVVLAARRLGPALSGLLRGRWMRGRPRTPWLAPSGTQMDGWLPGDQPDYYLLDTDLNGIADKMILRGYRPAARGSYGREPDRTALDARLDWTRPLRRGALGAFIEIDNLLNGRPVTAHDDQQEREVGFLAPGADGRLAASERPTHEEPASDPTLRIANPARGLPISAQAGRRIEIGVEWRF